MGYALYIIGILGVIACWVIVLIKMFKTEKPLIGILGILCNLWAFIWGWMNSSKLGLKNIMIAWTASIVLCIVGGAMSGAALAKEIEKQQKAIPASAPVR
jgi:hypothetical protein